jgi:hypothetical protein
MQFRARTIVETKTAESQIDNFKNLYERFEDGFEGVKWRLARNPECGSRINDRYLILKSENWKELMSVDLPHIRVLYSFDDNQVMIISVGVDG